MKRERGRPQKATTRAISLSFPHKYSPQGREQKTFNKWSGKEALFWVRHRRGLCTCTDWLLLGFGSGSIHPYKPGGQKREQKDQIWESSGIHPPYVRYPPRGVNEEKPPPPPPPIFLFSCLPLHPPYPLNRVEILPPPPSPFLLPLSPEPSLLFYWTRVSCSFLPYHGRGGFPCF